MRFVIRSYAMRLVLTLQHSNGHTRGATTVLEGSSACVCCEVGSI